jgi:hypothetical protein
LTISASTCACTGILFVSAGQSGKAPANTNLGNAIERVGYDNVNAPSVFEREHDVFEPRSGFENPAFGLDSPLRRPGLPIKISSIS